MQGRETSPARFFYWFLNLIKVVPHFRLTLLGPKDISVKLLQNMIFLFRQEAAEAREVFDKSETSHIQTKRLSLQNLIKSQDWA